MKNVSSVSEGRSDQPDSENESCSGSPRGTLSGGESGKASSSSRASYLERETCQWPARDGQTTKKKFTNFIFGLIVEQEHQNNIS
jgi:hypothetical protein